MDLNVDKEIIISLIFAYVVVNVVKTIWDFAKNHDKHLNKQ